MGTIKTGFWTFKFIIAPAEFENFLKECNTYNITFISPVSGYPQHNTNIVLENYGKFYNHFAAKIKQSISTFSYYVHLQGKNGKTSFNLRNENIRFLYNEQWVSRAIFYLMLSYPKGYAVPCENDPEHYIYEDILIHEPDIYPIYVKLTNSIKSFTKPFRFTNGIEEIKPSGVRISENAAKDLSSGYFFTQYNLQMQSFIK
jgi:hypothetical protein